MYFGDGFVKKKHTGKLFLSGIFVKTERLWVFLRKFNKIFCTARVGCQMLAGKPQEFMESLVDLKENHTSSLGKPWQFAGKPFDCI